jgi:hypothetical protein
MDSNMAPFSASLEPLVQNRPVRVLPALALIAVSAWAFFPHVAYRIAPTAFVNAELVPVAVPIADIIERTISVTLPKRFPQIAAPALGCAGFQSA